MANALRFAASPGLFRLLLAISVFFHHASSVNIGSAAVYIFFTLSGFWICKMWEARYSKTSSPYFTYIASRAWRLSPVFVLSSGLAWGLLWARGAIPEFSGSWSQQIFSNLLILGYNSLVFMANPPSWSLDMEFQFYLIAPLLIALVVKTRAVLIGCVLISVAASLLHNYATVAPYLLFFAIGLTCAHSGWRPGSRLAWCSLALSFAVFLILVSGPLRDVIIGGAGAKPLHAWNRFACEILALLMAPWALFTTGQKGGRYDGMFGELSYVVYLLHWPVLDVFNTAGGPSLHHLAEVCVAFVVTMILSYLVWRYFDHPINLARSRWVAGRMATTRQAESVMLAS